VSNDEDASPTARDREVSEACRNSGSRAERDAIVASYRVELIRRTQEELLAPFSELQREMDLHATNGGDCPYEAAAVRAYAQKLKSVVAKSREP